MNFEKKLINSVASPVVIHDKQNLETEIILPEYFDSINKILKCTITPQVDSFTVSSDRLSVAGNALISFLYVGEDKRLYNYNSELKYTKILVGAGIEIKDNYYVNQSVLALNYRAIGPKKVDIKCVIDVSMHVIACSEKEYISDFNEKDLFVKRNIFEIMNFKGINNKSFVLNHSYNCTGDEIIKTIIRTSSDLQISEKKILTDKVFVRGQCKVKILYESIDGELKNINFDIDFAEVSDVYGVSENDDVSIFNIQSYAICENNISDEKNTVDAQINVNFSVFVLQKENTAFINDIYSVDYDTTAQYSDISMIRSNEIIKEKYTVVFVADTFIDDDFTVCDCYAENLKITKLNNTQRSFELSGDLNALIKLSDSSLTVLSRSFSQEININGNINGIADIIDLNVLSISALRYEEKSIRFSADVTVCIAVNDFCKEKMLTSFELSETQKLKESGIVLYYADKGECVWNIAKDNRCSIDFIRRINNIEEDILSENQMLIIVNK